MSKSNSESLWTKRYILTILGMLFVFVPYSLYLPIMPLYVLEELGQSVEMAGLSNALFLLASVLFRTQTAGLESRFGHRKVLLGSSFLFFLSHLLFLVAAQPLWVLSVRFFGGACFAIANTAIMSMGSRFVPDSRKGEGIAYLTTVVTAGSAIGPFVGLKLEALFGFQAIFLFCGLSTLLGWALLLPIREKTQVAFAQELTFSPKKLLEWKAIPVCSVILLVSIAYAGVLTFAAVYAKEQGLAELTDWFFVVLAFCAVVVRVFTGRIMDLHGPNVVLYPAFALLAAGMILLGAMPSMVGMLGAAALIGAGYGVLVPTVQTIAVQKSRPERASVVTATYFTFLDLGLAAGAYLLGTLVSSFGLGHMYWLLSFFVIAVWGVYVLVHGRHVLASKAELNKELS